MREYKSVAIALLMCAPIVLLPSAARSQGLSNEPAVGLETTLPTVPATPLRPLEGVGADQQWAPIAARQPVASFIETLSSNDAAIKVIVGQGRLLTTKRPLANQEGDAPFIALGDPSVLDFAPVATNSRMFRLIGKRAGVTDLSFTTVDDETYSFEVHVGYDLKLLQAQLQQVFPDALLKLGQMREHLVVEGQARDDAQAARIIKMLEAYLASVQVSSEVKGQQQSGNSQAPTLPPQRPGQAADAATGDNSMLSMAEEGGLPTTDVEVAAPQIINLIRVPGVQQVLLQVRMAEVNRTALRQIGADLLGANNSRILGTRIGGSTVTAAAEAGAGAINDMGDVISLAGLAGQALSATSGSTTAFGIFPSSDFAILMTALRRNNVLTVLAEPNLVAMSGHQASFLAGGQFPVPVPQATGGVTTSVTVQFKDFGVRLNFLPFVLDEETVRLQVAPEVSTIDESLGTTLVVGGDPIPGLNTRRAETTVELKQGQTLAIAGLLEVDLDAQTQRIPGLGDLPYIGPFFSNTSHQRMEKELVVLVTPHLIAPLSADQVGPLPGEEIKDPTDKEFYLRNQIEGCTCESYRSTTGWNTPFCRVHGDGAVPQEVIHQPADVFHQGPELTGHQPQFYGPIGFSD